MKVQKSNLGRLIGCSKCRKVCNFNGNVADKDRYETDSGGKVANEKLYKCNDYKKRSV